MKVILIGYEGSKKIMKASSYLLNKYLINSETNFDIYFLNYGKFSQDDLFCGKYVELDSEQKGGVSSWSKYIIDYLNGLDDEYIIFALDDYFLSKPINVESYHYLLEVMMSNTELVGVSKLSALDMVSHRTHEYTMMGNNVYMLNENVQYTATTQFNVWRREVLIELLNTIKEPWEFEIDGSRNLNQKGIRVIGSTDIPLYYPECSSISSRHENKVSVLGNNIEDVENLIEINALNENDLIMGQWSGRVESYSEYKSNPIDSITYNCNDPAYYKLMLNKCTGVNV